MSEAYRVVLEEKVRSAVRRNRTDGRLAAKRRGQGHAEAAQEAMASGATAAVGWDLPFFPETDERDFVHSVRVEPPLVLKLINFRRWAGRG